MTLNEAIDLCAKNMRCFDVEIVLDRSRPLNEVAGATFRGLLGWAVAQNDQNFLNTVFEPGKNGNAPAGLVVRFMDPPSSDAYSAIFRVTTFSEPDKVPALLMRCVKENLVGMSFGAQETHVASVRTSLVRMPSFPFPEQSGRHVDIRIDFTSPFRLKRAGHLVGYQALSLPIVVSGAVERLHDLLLHYHGVDADFDREHSIALAGLALQERNSVKWCEFSRRSMNSDTPLRLDGCVGSMELHAVDKALLPLLAWAGYAHVGRHASAGNGAFDCYIVHPREPRGR